jgi:AhpD family alkylhydroperoxidase
MTTTNDTAQISGRLAIHTLAPGFFRAMLQLDKAVTKELDDAGIDPKLRELIRIRASQLNGCSYCIDMHTKDARAIGETEQRLYALRGHRTRPDRDHPFRAGPLCAWVADEIVNPVRALTA